MAALLIVELLSYFFDEQLAEDIELFTGADSFQLIALIRIGLLFDTVPEVRLVALSCLERVQLRRFPHLVDQVLTRALADSDAMVRRTALLLIGKLGYRSVEHIPAITAVIEKVMAQPVLHGQVSAATIIGIAGVREVALGRYLTQILTQRKKLPGLVDAQRAAIEAMGDAGLCDATLIGALLGALASEPAEDVRLTIHHCFKRLRVPPEVASGAESMLFALIESASQATRETALKILLTLGAASVSRSPRAALERAMGDEASSCRLQAFKLLELLLKHEKHRAPSAFESIVLSWLPSLEEGLADRNPSVVVQVLRAMAATKRLTFPAMDLGLPGEALVDRFYLDRVVAPLAEKVVLLLHSRRFKYSKEIRTWVLAVLAETPLLHEHLGSYKLMLNSDQISTLVEFAESFRGLGPQVLQYVPGLIAHIHAAGSPLVRHLVKLVLQATRTASAATLSALFSPHTLLSMVPHPTPGPSHQLAPGKAQGPLCASSGLLSAGCPL